MFVYLCVCVCVHVYNICFSLRLFKAPTFNFQPHRVPSLYMCPYMCVPAHILFNDTVCFPYICVLVYCYICVPICFSSTPRAFPLYFLGTHNEGAASRTDVSMAFPLFLGLSHQHPHSRRPDLHFALRAYFVFSTSPPFSSPLMQTPAVTHLYICICTYTCTPRHKGTCHEPSRRARS